jgi:adenylate kinase family enzyme
MNGTRSIILFNGMPGSGASDLCRNIVNELHFDHSIEHLATNEMVRAIGRGSIDSYYRRQVETHLKSPQSRLPLNRKLLYDIMSEALSRHDGADLLLIDSYPQQIDQVEDMYELAMLDDRHLRGLIMTEASENVAIKRLVRQPLPEHDRFMSEYEAEQMIQYYKNTYPAVGVELRKRKLPIEIINTMAPSPDTTDHAIQAINYMISPEDVDDTRGAQ